MCLMILAGCGTLTPIKEAALIDTATTAVAIEMGYQELNPLGPGAAAALKVAVIAWTETLPEAEKSKIHSVAAALWLGASANNLALIVGFPAAIAHPLGLFTTFYLLNPKKE